MEDLITIVDEENHVIGSAQRSEAQLKGLWHRIVVIYVTNPQGLIFIQKRSATTDTAPNKWDHSAAGHVDAEEEPEKSAMRELMEELGIKTNDLKFINIYKTEKPEDGKILKRFWYLFSVIYDGELSLQTEEISDGKYVQIDWLQNDMNTYPDLYTEGFKKSLQVYTEFKANI